KLGCVARRDSEEMRPVRWPSRPWCTRSCPLPGCRAESRGRWYEDPRVNSGARTGPMIVERIKAMLEACEAGTAAFPPTELFRGAWLVRISLDWSARQGGDRSPLAPLPGARWFSQAWLPSAFMSRYRGDRLAEARTHADGVLGHFVIGDPGTAALSLMPE